MFPGSVSWIGILACLSVPFLLLYIVSIDRRCVPAKSISDVGNTTAHAGEQVSTKHFQSQASVRSAAEVPSLTIFTAPRPVLSKDSNDPQRRALLSWLRLRPKATIVLLGAHESFHEAAAEFPEQVKVHSAIDYNFKGVPMFHTIIGFARCATTDVSVFINSDIVLLQDFYPVLQRAQLRFPHGFLVTAMRWDVEVFPYKFAAHSTAILYADDDGAEVAEDVATEYIRESGVLHTFGGIDLWAWNNFPVHKGGGNASLPREGRGLPLHSVTMPPFTFGRGRYDNWLVHEAVTSGLREVIDASDAMTNVHVAHGHEYLALKLPPNTPPRRADFWSANKKRSWEAFSNIFLSRTTGSFSSQMGTALHIPRKLARCDEPENGNLCITRRLRPGACRCEYSPYISSSQSEPKLVGHTITCGKVFIDNDYTLEVRPKKRSPPGLPHTLEQLLEAVGGERKSVTLTVASFHHRDMLLSFACRLQSLGVQNLVVAALDADTYRFAFTQGLAVFFSSSSSSSEPTLNGAEEDAEEDAEDGDDAEVAEEDVRKECLAGDEECHFRIMRVRMLTMQRILRAGYDVLYSDLDQLWLEDLGPHLSDGHGELLLVQNGWSSAAAAEANSKPDYDAGALIYARSSPATINMLSVFLVRAASSTRHSRHLFYECLCGMHGERRVESTGCLLPNASRVVFLSPKIFLLGRDALSWETMQMQERASRVQRIGDVVDRDVRRIGEVVDGKAKDTGVGNVSRPLAVHFVGVDGKGVEAKAEKMEALGYWHFDNVRRMCIHAWHGRLAELEER